MDPIGYRIDGGDWQIEVIQGETEWSITVDGLKPGGNRVELRAADYGAAVSSIVAREIIVPPPGDVTFGDGFED